MRWVLIKVIIRNPHCREPKCETVLKVLLITFTSPIPDTCNQVCQAVSGESMECTPPSERVTVVSVRLITSPFRWMRIEVSVVKNVLVSRWCIQLLSQPFPPIFLEMGRRNLCVEPKDFWPTTFDSEIFLEWDLWPTASASPSPDCEPTSKAAATPLTLLEWIFIDSGTL